MADLGTPDNPLRVAIIGSGPAGFYAAEHLLKRDEVTVEVDMFDRLPTPFGLVRAGVAPDHPKIKSVIRVYEKTAARDGFRFFGNVEIGRDDLASPSSSSATTRSSTPTAPPPTASSASRARTCPARTRRPSSSTGTTPTPTSPTTSSTSRASARS